MSLIADILLVAGAMGAGLYCLVLGRRLNRFNDLEKGVGGAVAVLSVQVDDLTRTLSAAQTTASHSATTLTDLTKRAETVSRTLELQMASLHDLPTTTTAQPTQAASKKPSSASQSEEHQAAPQTAPSPHSKPDKPMFTRHRNAEDAA